MAAEIIMIVEDQDARPRPHRLAIIMRRRQTGEAAADDDQIISLAHVLGVAQFQRAIAQGVRRFIGTIMAAAQAGARRRIRFVLRHQPRHGGAGGHASPHRANRHRHAADKVPPRDRPVHAELAIAQPVAHPRAASWKGLQPAIVTRSITRRAGK